MSSSRGTIFDGDEPGFVNAVLDRLAHRKRAAEFGETPPDDELPVLAHHAGLGSSR
jgi:hypothetical protein